MEPNDAAIEGEAQEEKLIDRVMGRIDVPDTVKEIVEGALRGVADELERSVRSSVALEIEDGICSFGFHRSVAEFMPDGSCEWCRKHYSEHDGVLVCKRKEPRDRADTFDDDDDDDDDDDAQPLEPGKPDRPPSFELEPRNLLEVAPGLKVPCQVETAEQRGERLRKEGDLRRFECEWPQCKGHWLHAHDEYCGALEGRICSHMVSAGWQPAVVQVNSLQDDGKTMKRRARLLGWLCPVHADAIPEGDDLPVQHER